MPGKKRSGGKKRNKVPSGPPIIVNSSGEATFDISNQSSMTENDGSEDSDD